MWGNNGRQDLGKWDTPSNTGTRVGRQWETWGDKASWRQIWSKPETPSNTGTHVGRQWETMKRNRRQRETGRQEGRQWEAIGWTRGDNGRQVETRPRGSGQTIQHRLTCEETMGDKGRQRRREGGRTIQQRETRREMGDKGKQDLGKADTPSSTGRQGETRPREGGHTIQGWGTIQHRHTCGETRGDKTSGRRTHHPTQARISRETMGDNEKQDFGKVDHPTQAHMLGDNGGQWETMGNNWRQPETRIDKKGDNGRQGETRPREGGHTIQHRHTCGETMGENGEQWGTMGDQGRHLEKAGTPSKQGKQEGRWETIGETRPWKGGHAIQHKRILWGDNGRQGETKPREGGHTVQHRQTRQDPTQHRHTCGETMGDKKGRQDVEKADAPSNTGTSVGRQWETMGSMGEKGRQDLGKADTPSNTGTHVGREWGTMGDGWGRGDQGDKTSKRRAHHPRKGNKKGGGSNGRRQGETRPWEGGHTIQHKRILWGDNGRQEKTRGDKSLGKADMPSNKGKQEGIQWETKGDKTLGKADTPSNKGNQGGHLKKALRTASR